MTENESEKPVFEKIDEISNKAIFISSLLLFTGLTMFCRLLGNTVASDKIDFATQTDWIIGISGIVIMLTALILPITRIRNAINMFPKRKTSIIKNHIIATIIIFLFLGLFNTWAWSTDHSKTRQGGSHKNTAHGSLRSAGYLGPTDSGIIVLRGIAVTLTLIGAAVYGVGLFAPQMNAREAD